MFWLGMLRIRYSKCIHIKPRSIGFHFGYKVEFRSGRWSIGTRGVCFKRLRRSRTTCLSFIKVVESRIPFRKVEKVMKLRIFFDFRMSYSSYRFPDLRDGINNERATPPIKISSYHHLHHPARQQSFRKEGGNQQSYGPRWQQLRYHHDYKFQNQSNAWKHLGIVLSLGIFL